jgi:hypothetical protein
MTAMRWMALAAAGWILGLHAQGQEPSKATEAPASKGAENAPAIEYKPPPKGAPRGRIGGGTRGLDSRELVMAVVAPDHTGWSAVDQPDLYWYVSQPVGTAPELTIIEDNAVDPLVELSLPPAGSAGLQKVSLRALGKKLEQGKEYRWFVTLVTDKSSRSKDVVASGRVSYVPPAREVLARWQDRPPAQRAAAMAADGYWYDVVATLEGAGLHRTGAALYESAGLREVARFARSRP